MNVRYAFVAERAGHRCEYCKAPEVIFNFRFEVEHITPPGAGGADEESNWALACRSCNLYKSNYLNWLDEITRALVPLFQPRRQKWTEHFEVKAATAMIVGLTPTGRATVSLLKMNATIQVAARLQWLRLGLYTI